MTISEAGEQFKIVVEGIVTKVNAEAASRGARAVNALRNSELEVLSGTRTGRVYRKPFSRSTYRASAPGEPPARRTGALRLHWNGTVEGNQTGRNEVSITAVLQSNEEYSVYLENGTGRMQARPFKDAITDKAWPEIVRIYSESYE